MHKDKGNKDFDTLKVKNGICEFEWFGLICFMKDDRIAEKECCFVLVADLLIILSLFLNIISSAII